MLRNIMALNCFTKTPDPCIPHHAYLFLKWEFRDLHDFNATIPPVFLGSRGHSHFTLVLVDVGYNVFGTPSRPPDSL